MRIVKVCNGCHKVLYLNNFSPRSSRCKECKRSGVIPIKSRAMPSHPHRKIAHNTVGDAVKLGLLVRESCMCGDSNSQGHHEDYSKPLDVIWLCNSCHRSLHNRKNINLKFYKYFCISWNRNFKFI